MPLAAATVFIVDDDAEVRRAVSLLIRSVGLADHSYASAQEFLKNYDATAPGCLVLDIRMPGMSGLELQKGSSVARGLPPIIFLTGHGEISTAIQAIRAGAIDFLQKPFSPQVLLERIREAIELDLENRRKCVLADELQERVIRLTEREREIMQYLAQGISTKRIAGSLAISPKTVDNHRESILEKMNVDNTTQLAHLIAIQ
ncbi:MAG: response regulator [Planctomycetota bacterium]|nr:response regulator [Planctomycetota bacterium]